MDFHWPDPNSAASPWRVRVHVDMTSGVPRCVGLDLHGYEGQLDDEDDPARPIEALGGLTEVTTVALRQFQVPSLLFWASGMLAAAEEVFTPESTAAREAFENRRRRYGADHYREVADVYSAAREAPTRAVSEHFKMSRSTASHHVDQARKLGFLPPTERGRAVPKRKEES